MLLAVEVSGRDSATRRMRCKTANFPTSKTFSSWLPEESTIPEAKFLMTVDSRQITDGRPIHRWQSASATNCPKEASGQAVSMSTAPRPPSAVTHQN
ncbi:hypothetical protein [Nocardia vaccinii]|uniref:hypothetical protein n=1 Tax=Nocardia vaccinii TaxID=1822 RepID=UPI001C3F98D0|nr:hypothetical protein [Nocardia vaccinii]